MTHVEQGDLQAYLDGEVAASSRAAIETHLHSCTSCAAELDELRSAAALFTHMVRRTDTEAPIAKARHAVTAARRGASHRRFAFSRSTLAKAALFTLGFAALASAAIPGWPLRKWISHTFASAPPAPTAQPTTSAPAPRAPAPSAVPSRSVDEAALSIQPSAGRVRVILTDVAQNASVRVRLVDTDRAVVQASGAAAHGRFRTGPGRIELVGVSAGIVTIDLPRSVKDMRVEVDGKIIFQSGQ